MRPQVLAFLALVTAVGVPAFTANQPTMIHVDDDASPGGDGSGRFPFDNLPDAVAAAHATASAVVIIVEPGDYPLNQSLVIERALELRGSTELIYGDDSWPTGQVLAGTETRVFLTNPLAQTLVQIGRQDGGVLSGVRISGFVLEGSTTGAELRFVRVQDYRAADNIFRTPAGFGLESIASSGLVTGNHFSGLGTGAVFTGGYSASPATVVFRSNRSVRNNLGGALLNGASINIPELGDQLHAIVRNNDLSDNSANPNAGFGLRVFIVRRDLGAPGEEQSSGHVSALVQDNRIDGNRVGVLLDAGFPYRLVNIGGIAVCDTRVYSGTIELNLAGNTLTGSLVTPALLTFTRNVSGRPVQLALWQYLQGSTFTLSDRDGILQDAWIDHPESDPFLGPCPGDAVQESLGNVLIYNGAVLPPNGRNF